MTGVQTCALPILNEVERLGRPVGVFGVRLIEGKSYSDSLHLGFGKSKRYSRDITQDEPVDIVKGRFVAMRTEWLATLPMRMDGEDDIAVSAHVGGGVLPVQLQKRFTDLPQGRESLSYRPDHMERREATRQSVFRRA